MAAASSSLGTDFKEELSCCICLELFTRPKVLPCGHIFCQGCLQNLTRSGGAFKCPICRQQVRLPHHGVSCLPDSHNIANMCEKLRQNSSSEETREQPQSGNRCSFHPSEMIKVFCKQCQIPVCDHCLNEAHDDHHIATIKKAAQEKSLLVRSLINEGKNIMESYLSLFRSLTERKDNFAKKLNMIQTERDRVLEKVNKLSAACDQAEQEMEKGGVEFLSQQTTLTEVVGKYRGKAAPTPVQTQPAVFEPMDTTVPVLGHVRVQSLPSAPIPAVPAPIPAAPTSRTDAVWGKGHHHDFKEELSCCICLELFTRPKVLPCGHIFCQGCLQNLTRSGGAFKCPICRQQVRLPHHGVSCLPDSHNIANMCEKLRQNSSSEETREQPQSGNRCSFHPSEMIKVFCKQCQIPVCDHCLNEAHDDHHIATIKKAAQEKSLLVRSLINEGKNIMESYLSLFRSLTERKDNFAKKLNMIQTERDRVLEKVNKLSAACDQAEQEMEKGGVEFLSQQTTLTEVVGKYRGKAAPTPVQTQPAVFEPMDTTVPVLGHVRVQSLPSAPIPAVPAPIPAAPTSRTDAVWGKGHHHGNQRQPQRVTFGGWGREAGQFRYPFGVTVSKEGEVFVADFENQRIQVFTLWGTFVRQFPTVVSGGHRMRPWNIAMDREGNLWVVGRADSAEFAVLYNKLGFRQHTIDLQKSASQRGIAVDTRRNHLLITQTTADGYNMYGEVLAFRLDGTVGRQQGMKQPWYITVDGEGNILVSDVRNHCVYVYKEYGQFQFGSRGSGVGELCNPHGICTDSAGNIIVADSGNSRLVLFDKTGRCLKQVTTDMRMPLAVAVAPQGKLVVTDFQEHTVNIFF
uniref:RING-type E3 ubiquitin transferase n=1 Tax=Branchiostoma floridae TaxID=7739 RepID=C3Z055_BRAFL|eukprot:XP_002598102.1 hypothetical protein BRAFLDRAFT_85680 [Branchiostoma floridae]